METPPRRDAELVHWALIGRAVRPGSWAEQAEATPDRIERAVADGRDDDAVALVGHLAVEAAEIHELFTDWSRRIPELLGTEQPVDGKHQAPWDEFHRAAAAWRPPAPLEPVLEALRTAHDGHLEHVATLVDLAVEVWGEERLGELWAELQADGAAFYRATYGPDQPWARSSARLLQVAIEGMHGHLGGPRRRGEVTVEEHADRVSLSFEPCGSGGRVLAAGRNGVVEGRHDFAWNTPGVCRYCVHCCVLQQLGPIDAFGYPARVIDPPTEPGARCTWTVYRDPALVPDAAYERVGRTRGG
jgi:hypothetical protein